MEENRIKMSLSTVILITISVIIAIVAILFFIQKTTANKELEEATSKISRLEKQTNDQEKTINNLQGKLENLTKNDSTNNIEIPTTGNQVSNDIATNNTINNSVINNNIVDNTISNTITNSITNNIQNNTTTTLTEQEAISIGKEKYKKAFECYWGITTSTENKIQFNGNEYVKVENINNIKSVFSSNGFEKYVSGLELIQKDGDYYKPDVARGSNIYYMGNILKISNSTDNKVEFISEERYYTSDEDRQNNNTNTTNYIAQNNKFTMVKENGVWKVEEFTLPN